MSSRCSCANATYTCARIASASHRSSVAHATMLIVSQKRCRSCNCGDRFLKPWSASVHVSQTTARCAFKPRETRRRTRIVHTNFNTPRLGGNASFFARLLSSRQRTSDPNSRGTTDSNLKSASGFACSL